MHLHQGVCALFDRSSSGRAIWPREAVCFFHESMPEVRSAYVAHLEQSPTSPPHHHCNEQSAISIIHSTSILLAAGLHSKAGEKWRFPDHVAACKFPALECYSPHSFCSAKTRIRIPIGEVVEMSTPTMTTPFGISHWHKPMEVDGCNVKRSATEGFRHLPHCLLDSSTQQFGYLRNSGMPHHHFSPTGANISILSHQLAQREICYR